MTDIAIFPPDFRHLLVPCLRDHDDCRQQDVSALLRVEVKIDTLRADLFSNLIFLGSLFQFLAHVAERRATLSSFAPRRNCNNGTVTSDHLHSTPTQIDAAKISNLANKRFY